MQNPFRVRVREAVADAEREAAEEQRRRRSTFLAQQAAELEQQSAQYDAAILGHQVAERRESDRLTAIGKRLDASAKALAAADKAAITALGKLSQVAAAYDEAVAEAARELRAAGLPLRETIAGEVLDHSIGGGPRDGVSVAGRQWVRLAPADVLRRALWAVLRARGDRSAELLSAQWRVRQLNWAGVLSEPPPAGSVSRWTPELIAARAEQAAALDGPAPSARALEEHDRRLRQEEHEQRQSDARRKMALRRVESGEIAIMS